MQRRGSAADRPPRVQKVKYVRDRRWQYKHDNYVRYRDQSQGIGLIAVAVAGMAALWWWRKISSDDTQEPSTAPPRGAPSPAKASSSGTNPKKDRARKKEQRTLREAKRQQYVALRFINNNTCWLFLNRQQQRGAAPEPEAVVKDERTGIDGSMLYLNHSEFTGKTKTKKR